MAKRDFVINCNSSDQIVIKQTETADFVKINICVILKTFGHDYRLMTGKQQFNTFYNKPGTLQNVEKVKGFEYFLKALYIGMVSPVTLIMVSY
jgi:hypothetical protein